MDAHENISVFPDTSKKKKKKASLKLQEDPRFPVLIQVKVYALCKFKTKIQHATNKYK